MVIFFATSRVTELYEAWEQEQRQHLIIGEWLEAHSIEFLYEHFLFQVGSKTYTPDFCLTDHGLFIEGKGVWSVGGRRKFTQFREFYPKISILIIPYIPSLVNAMKRETKIFLKGATKNG